MEVAHLPSDAASSLSQSRRATPKAAAPTHRLPEYTKHQHRESAPTASVSLHHSTLIEALRTATKGAFFINKRKRHSSGPKRETDGDNRPPESQFYCVQQRMRLPVSRVQRARVLFVSPRNWCRREKMPGDQGAIRVGCGAQFPSSGSSNTPRQRQRISGRQQE